MEALLAKALPEIERHLDFLDTRRLATSHTLLKSTLHEMLRHESDVLAKLANDQAIEDAAEVWSTLSDVEDDEARTHSPLVFFFVDKELQRLAGILNLFIEFSEMCQHILQISSMFLESSLISCLCQFYFPGVI